LTITSFYTTTSKKQVLITQFLKRERKVKTLQGDITLGKKNVYISTYSKNLLCVISRADGRAEINSIIESKSFKLYLNSFNQTQFSGFSEVEKTLQDDLSQAVACEVGVNLFSVSDVEKAQTVDSVCIDDLDIYISEYQVNANLLKLDESDKKIAEKVHSHLLKTNCPITEQPDWASVYIFYRGTKINLESLLQYLCSYRMHNDFHEQCVERIYKDLMECCACEELTVEARYLRRGGLDINPFRSSSKNAPLKVRTFRQ
jgi:7-cyano-7-deazaguanine reductase